MNRIYRVSHSPRLGLVPCHTYRVMQEKKKKEEKSTITESKSVRGKFYLSTGKQSDSTINQVIPERLRVVESI
jgi:hypothetical protein